MLTKERLKEVLRYDENTGLFSWLRRKVSGNWNSRYSGKVAGSVTLNGYISIRIDDKAFLAHRLAFLYMKDAWPENEVDHKDGNRANNVWGNLRDVTLKVNAQNKRLPPSHQKTGLPLGVHMNMRLVSNKYSAKIKIGDRQVHLGYFRTPEQASQAYVTEKRRSHAGCMI